MSTVLQEPSGHRRVGNPVTVDLAPLIPANRVTQNLLRRARKEALGLGATVSRHYSEIEVARADAIINSLPCRSKADGSLTLIDLRGNLRRRFLISS
jgi:hypothetical protein